jgi:hypothetical protein
MLLLGRLKLSRMFLDEKTFIEGQEKQSFHVNSISNEPCQYTTSHNLNWFHNIVPIRKL